LRSTEYNRSYYDPSVTYLPWPKGDGSRYDDAPAAQAPLDPNFPDATVNLTATNSFTGTNYYPAVFFKKTTSGSITKNTTTYSCPDGYSNYDSTRCRKRVCISYRSNGSCRTEGWDYQNKIATPVSETKACGSVPQEWYAAWYGSPSSYEFTDPAEAL